MKQKYKAIALDLDGTLMDSNKKLSDENRNTIWTAIDAGIKVILASGRPMFGVLPVAKLLELDKRGGYVLAYNGGNILDCKSGELIHSKSIPGECIRDICEAARKYEVQPLTYYGDKVLVENSKDEYVIKEAFCNSTETYEVPDIASFVNYPVSKILAVGPHEKLLPLKEYLESIHGCLLDLFFSEEYFLEIMPKNVSKDTSLAILMEKLGLGREDLIACGDGMNDISMIKYAGLGVAMENAYPPVKEACDFIAPLCDDNGVAFVIKKFML